MIEFFTDPVLRAPTLGCLFMCIASSLIGVLVLLRKESLLSETLSHAAYPGALLFMGLASLVGLEEWGFFAVLAGAAASSFLAWKAVRLLTKENVKSDAALTFVLSVFFGVGILLSSIMQRLVPHSYREVKGLLLGQAATMEDFHVMIYGALALLSALFLVFFFRPLQAFLFDPEFARGIRLPMKTLEKLFAALFIFSLVVSIRCVGVVLISSMTIAPAIAARSLCSRLDSMCIVAGCVGLLSAFLGNWTSVAFSLPTGPCIVAAGSCLAFLSLLFAPERGLIGRFVRIASFRLRRLEENILKGLWKKRPVPHSFVAKIALLRLQRAGWIEGNALTIDGERKAASIVRLHRLWELYLTSSLGVEADRVHKTAEEMEHILTPEMEESLTRLLENPKVDPHSQPIPGKGL